MKQVFRLSLLLFVLLLLGAVWVWAQDSVQSVNDVQIYLPITGGTISLDEDGNYLLKLEGIPSSFEYSRHLPLVRSELETVIFYDGWAQLEDAQVESMLWAGDGSVGLYALLTAQAYAPEDGTLELLAQPIGIFGDDKAIETMLDTEGAYLMLAVSNDFIVEVTNLALAESRIIVEDICSYLVDEIAFLEGIVSSYENGENLPQASYESANANLPSLREQYSAECQ